MTQLAIIQLGGAIASSVIVKEAEYFSRLGGHKFDISSTVCTFIVCLYLNLKLLYIDLERGQRSVRCSYCSRDDLLRAYPTLNMTSNHIQIHSIQLSKRVSGGLNSTQLLLRRLITRIFGAGVVTGMHQFRILHVPNMS